MIIAHIWIIYGFIREYSLGSLHVHLMRDVEGRTCEVKVANFTNVIAKNIVCDVLLEVELRCIRLIVNKVSLRTRVA